MKEFPEKVVTSMSDEDKPEVCGVSRSAYLLWVLKQKVKNLSYTGNEKTMICIGLTAIFNGFEWHTQYTGLQLENIGFFHCFFVKYEPPFLGVHE